MTTTISTLTALAKDINAAHAACETAARGAIEHAIRAGELLIEAKGQCHHGQWLLWLKENFAGTPRTAQHYMRVAVRWPELAANTKPLSLLTFTQAIAKLAEPRKAALPHAPDPEPEPTGKRETRELVDPKSGEVHQAEVRPAVEGQPERMVIVSKEEYEADARMEQAGSRPDPTADDGFHVIMNRLFRMTNSFRDAGGIEAAQAEWSKDQRQRAVNQIAHIAAILTEWQDYLTKELQG